MVTNRRMRNVREDAHKKESAFLVDEPLRSGRTPPPRHSWTFSGFFRPFFPLMTKNLKKVFGGVGG